MKSIPSVSDQIDENKIFKIINKNFSKLAPSYYAIISNWLIRSYKVFGDIDKYIIVVYLINKDFEFYRRNSLNINYENFLKDKTFLQNSIACSLECRLFILFKIRLFPA